MPSLTNTLILALAPLAMAGPLATRQNGFFNRPSGSFPSFTGSRPGMPSSLPDFTGSFPGFGGSGSGTGSGSGSGSDTGNDTGSDSGSGNGIGGGSGLGNGFGTTGGFSGSSQNGLSGACKDVTVIFARGTSEMGNVGSVAGPPMFQAIADQIGADKLAVQGVEYAASVGGIMQGGDRAGTQKMAAHVQDAIKKCPNTKVVLSGYSQGAMLVHNAAKSLPADVSGKIAAVVNFGDPFKSQPVQGVDSSKVKIICHTGDSVCLGTGAITPAHLNYGQDAKAAADFIVKAIGK